MFRELVEAFVRFVLFICVLFFGCLVFLALLDYMVWNWK